jgi:hypothetical protein
VAGFSENWVRGMAAGLLRLALLGALGCAFGGIFSTPVALFVGLSYLLLGALVDPELGAPTRDFAGNVVSWDVKQIVGYSATRLVMLAVVSFRSFDVTHHLARGYLVPAGTLAHLLVVRVVLQGGALSALGIWCFTRRELGKVIRR